jgi:uncharacterized repeat protein (TIGR04076 family)
VKLAKAGSITPCVIISRRRLEKMEENVRKALKERIGITDEDLEKVWPGQQKLFPKLEEIGKWRTIFECTSSKYCSVGIKVGDKFVFKANVLLAEESTAPLCISALSPCRGRIYTIFDRIAEGLDPNGMCLASTQCGDTGVEYGGTGRATFKIYCQRIG